MGDKRKRPRSESALGTEGSGDGHNERQEKVAKVSGQVNFIEEGGKACTHEVSWPSAVEDVKAYLPPVQRAGPPAKQYPFALDPFQQAAINALEAGHSVLVAAHTSAGKTVVAEYAFAMALRDKQRVIYTSPLKALSNQKYREFFDEFQDVGLLTGDVTINPNATCLVMTTEILRSMLYNGSEVVRETALIVYDEIHYLRDKERGVVWEESIVLAPHSARFAFLSATIPNAREFADWIAQTHGSPCHVVYTDYRPTPLQHYMFPAGGDGLYMVVDEKGVFRSDNFHKAVAAMEEAEPDRKGGTAGRGKASKKKNAEETDIYKIVRLLMKKEYDPVIIFSFSKKECEALALQMASLDLNTPEEKAVVERVFWNAVDVLKEEDRRLPQLANALPMLKTGIGVHHSGLLPILKEVIEILFQEGLVKALFATETFSTGLNMPAKTVVFTHARKFDGESFRWLSSGEYIQMSGRAGRRGLDDRGIVVLMLDAKMEPSIARGMVKGAPDPLYSEFRLSYCMLLNLLLRASSGDRRGDPEAVMRSSFRQFQALRALPALQDSLLRLQEEVDGVEVEDEEAVAQVLEIESGIEGLRREMRRYLFAPKTALPFLNPGRLVRVLKRLPGAPGTADGGGEERGGNGGEEEEARNGEGASTSGRGESVWGIIVNFEKAGTPKGGPGEMDSDQKNKRQSAYIVDVLVNCEDTSKAPSARTRPQLLDPGDREGLPQVVSLTLPNLDALSSIRLYLPKDLRPPDARRLALKTLEEVLRRFPEAVPLLDPESDMRIKDDGFRKLQRKLEHLEGLLEKHPLLGSPSLPARLAALRHKLELKRRLRMTKREIKSASNLILQDELKGRRRVLRRLEYVDSEGVVTRKGRVAAEIQSADELVLTELIFSGTLSELRPEELVALISCLVWTEKGDAPSRISPSLEAPFKALQETARRVGKVAVDANLGTDVEEYVNGFRPELMEVAAAWSRGTRFADIAKMTDIFEGSLVRAIRRIEEILRQLMSAASVIGDLDLKAKFEEASDKIKRDVIFAASLYL